MLLKTLVLVAALAAVAAADAVLPVPVKDVADEEMTRACVNLRTVSEVSGAQLGAAECTWTQRLSQDEDHKKVFIECTFDTHRGGTQKKKLVAPAFEVGQHVGSHQWFSVYALVHNPRYDDITSFLLQNLGLPEHIDRDVMLDVEWTAQYPTFPKSIDLSMKSDLIALHFQGAYYC